MHGFIPTQFTLFTLREAVIKSKNCTKKRLHSELPEEEKICSVVK